VDEGRKGEKLSPWRGSKSRGGKDCNSIAGGVKKLSTHLAKDFIERGGEGSQNHFVGDPFGQGKGEEKGDLSFLCNRRVVKVPESWVREQVGG